MVLGVQWLSTLGPILWDFSNLCMEFTWNGLKHVLRGVTKSDCKLIKGSSLNKLIVKGPQVALLSVTEAVQADSPPRTSTLFHLSTNGADRSSNPETKSAFFICRPVHPTINSSSIPKRFQPQNTSTRRLQSHLSTPLQVLCPTEKCNRYIRRRHAPAGHHTI